MKKKIVLTLFTLLSSLFTANAQQGQWTWMNGSDTLYSPGHYGTQGVFSSLNSPPGLLGACEWTDKNGNFWLFGGLTNYMSINNDLWEFKPAINQWAWIKGPGIPNQNGSYGTQLVPSITNNPRGRAWGMPTWVDTAGDLWLFGGTILGPYELNDLWRYHIATNEWTWMKGSNTNSDPGHYGTIQVPSPTNNPPSRGDTKASWIDANNCLWMFGGCNFLSYYSDMWKFDISTNEWTWMKGPNTTNQPAVYGTIGVSDPANIPNGRTCNTKWKDSNGNFWLFGGEFSSRFYNDLWRFDPTTNEWTWMSGTDTIFDRGTIGTQCVSCTSNIPCARDGNSACWTRSGDNFLNFGGEQSPAPLLNDLWNYNVSTNQWTWISGSIVGDQPGNYGTILVSSPSNMPCGRLGNVGWSDNLGNLWMFGGENNGGYLNDMWRFVPDTTCQNPGTPINITSSFTANHTSGCSPLMITFTNNSINSNFYSWRMDTTTFSSLTNPTYYYLGAGTHTVMLIARASCSADTSTLQITVFPTPNPVISGSNLCDSMPTILDAGIYTSYHWNTGATTETITVTTPNPYFVTVTNTYGCTGTTYPDSIRVSPSPHPNITGDSLCSVDSMRLNAGSYSHYLWSNGRTTSINYITTAGTYFVTVTDYLGCTGTDSVIVTNNPLPTPIIIQQGDTLTITNFTTGLQWFKDHTLITNATNPQYIITGTGCYYAEETDTNGCSSKSDTICFSFAGINEINNNHGISIYPNPNNGNFILEYHLSSANVVLEVKDLLGRTVVKQNIIGKDGKQNVDASSLNNGMYFYEIRMDGSGLQIPTSARGKFIKE